MVIGAGGQLAWRWQEVEGPPVAAPNKKGFGTRMLEQALAAELSARVEISYPPTGLICTVEGAFANT